MFEHSVKVPRHYKVAANILKKVSTEGGSVKTLLYDNKLRHFRTNVLFALITETIKHAAHIDKIFECSGLLTKESRFDPWLAKVLTAELLFGKKSLPGKSKPEQTILSYKEHFEKYIAEHEGDLKTEVVRRPRYVRINTNHLTTSDAIRAFQEEGYHFIRCTSGSYNDYLSQIQSLTEYDFTQDYHVKTIFVFAPGTKLHEHELYVENKIILQDKATAMAVHLLAPPAGSTVLDLCAAPGMKTTQLAAYMRNEGKIYAVERNEQRYQTLCDFVEKTGSKCVETLHKDALEIKRGDYDEVEYILLDPSCSGSGMELCVHNYIEDTRLAKLTSLQEKFLKHAMNAFPKAKRIVYSTCSLFPEENERVITNIVKTSRAKWRVQDVKELLKGQWNNFGSGMYGSIGTRCMYAKPDTDFTIGFFLAVLDRDPKDFDKQEKRAMNATNGVEDVLHKKNRKVNKEVNSPNCNNIDTEPQTGILSELDMQEQNYDQNDNDWTHKKKKRKKLKVVEENCPNNENFTGNPVDKVNEVTDENVNSKTTKKSKLTPSEEGENINTDTEEAARESTISGEVNNKKRKKNKKSDKDKKNDFENIEANYCDDQEEGPIESSSQKRKRGGTKDAEELLIESSNTDNERRKRKKKRQRDFSEIESELQLDSNDSEKSGGPKKKKRKEQIIDV
ncbi:unnamed protein product, partial [Iphiclides podalirius]